MEEEEEPVEEGAPAWMATFSDMCTLLLTFFVLLLSFANMDVQHFKTALGSVKEAFGVQFKYHGDFEARATTPVELSAEQSSPYISKGDASSLFSATRSRDDAEAQRLREYLKKHKLNKHIEVVAGDGVVILRVTDFALFETGSDQLTRQADEVLRVVAELFGKTPAALAIEGHTDSVPISTGRFPSNWELSTARAAAVLRHLIHHYRLEAARLSLAGYAETHPVGENGTAEGRRQNRRVEFVFRRPSRHEGRLFAVGEPESSASSPGSASGSSSSPGARKTPKKTP